ncbi:MULTISPECIES: hydroxymethylglutaryl-CoA lyase [Dethiosulfovibrio]|uniref:Hydroxymethylglutaryl-CoA lyase n=2 Tax=Dethiosulfovibrio TaxID=47054 RepID=A0ABS9EPX0_9BACT|nr:MULTISPECIES: hydroxymethylglutaryl-CoA lyase [Dethiosulfovibrio]MCF4113257.1 hydroxymethylglutaryl-CoA lyase [Dethiosulfovibrio russensis]MCF4142321.1 hydroxymethylglutaryl-CoA lyase [Dethiosulfovibrio marinus]MCF4144629.1 hydroxymethylglutaryl-CoA lyase [Dethiosulfovibrio acidaminovorans]
MSSPSLPREVVICEVGPRDGLQNESTLLSVENKLALIEGIIDAGAKSVEVGSFVHPKAVPSMADTDEVVKRLKKIDGVEYRGLALNFKGVERACEVGITKVKVSVSASRTHSRQNSNATPEEVIAGFGKCAAFCSDKGVELSGAISTAFGYTDEGIISLEEIYPIVDAYLDLGIREISMSDTTGMAHPRQVYEYMTDLIRRYPDVTWTLHPHNTRGMALANIYAAMTAGVSHFDASFAGLGGCPFAPGASGNVATEDVVNMLETMNIRTGFDLKKVLAVARKVEEFVGHPGDSSMLRVSDF